MENSLYNPLPIMKKVACKYPITNKEVYASKERKELAIFPKTNDGALKAVREAYKRGETHGGK